jgi:hypothetical protein
MITFRLILSVAICAVFLSSCKKDNNDSLSNKNRLYEFRSHWYDTIGYYLLKYNQVGKLTQIKATSNNQPLDTSNWTISYDAENRMTGYTLTHNRISWFASFKFLHDHAGRIIAKVYSSNNGPSHIYSYDNLGRLISDSSYSYSENSYFPRGVFKYDSRSNLIEYQFSYYDSYYRRLESWPIKQASHNNKPNPYSNLGLTLYFVMDETTRGLSKTNAVEVREGTTSSRYEFEYYPDGLTQKTLRVDEKEVYQEFFYE